MSINSEQQLADIAKEFIEQGKSARRWKLLIVLLVVIYISTISYISLKDSVSMDTLLGNTDEFAAEIILSGSIAIDAEINTDNVTDLLNDAFKEEKSKAVILRLNSPGGSPVQASQLHNLILHLKKKHKKKIYAVIDDICVSACYYIAAATDEIYVDKSSIVGSIGVILSSYGAVEAMKKLGIERRLYTAGEYKGALDMFSTQDREVVKHIQNNILNKTHQNFIQAVKTGRGERISTNKDLFSGLFWLGDEAIELGLVDALGDAYHVAGKVIGVEKRIIYEAEKSLLERLTQATMEGVVLAVDKIATQSNSIHLH